MNDALANDMSAIKHELHHLIVLSFTYRRSLELHRLLNVHSPGVVQIATVVRGTSHDVQEKMQRFAIRISRHDKNKDKK